MRLSAYGAVNILLAALWVVFIPSYWMLVHCPTCPDFLKAAGELVELLWHPNTHRLKLKYGAGRGQAQYLPGSDNGVYRPACVPCPSQLLEQQVVPYLDMKNAQTSGKVSDTYPKYSVQPEDLVHCVRVTGFNLRPDATTSITGGAEVDATTYVKYQVFGPNYKEVWDALYPGARAVRSLNWIRSRTTLLASMGDFYNTKLFKKRSPWPFLNAPMGPHTIEPELYGYYLLNGKPFIPPKLWDLRPYSAEAGDHYGHKPQGYDAVVTPTSNIGELTSAASYTRSIQMQDQAQGRVANVSRENFGPESKGVEHEWWYSNLCPKASGCQDDWWGKTSMQYWGADHYRDYIARFFAGGDSFVCIWIAK